MLLLRTDAPHKDFFMKLLIWLLTLGSLGYGIFWAMQKNPAIKQKVESVLPYGEFHTLELRHTAEQIMESHRKDLLKSNKHKYLSSEIHFYPHLLMEVKYSVSAKKTEESLILWDLCDGEMVTNTYGWEKTHGFGDCLTAGTSRNEFKVLNFLSKKGGSSSRQEISNGLHLDNHALDSLLDGLQRKHLLVFSGNQYRLHLQNPLLKTSPRTRMSERLVTKTWKNAQKIPKRFSFSQIERLTKAAFGEDFAIRHTSVVYLPIHNIVVQNPDGSLHTSLWNALNGERIIYLETLQR